MNDDAVARLAAHVRAALDGADLDAFADLLAPDVTWGAPGDPRPSCENRRQVLEWYRAGQLAGMRARVVDVTAHDDKILVGLMVCSGDAANAETPRWQVLTVSGGRVSDIRGYDDEALARAAARPGG